MYEGNRFLKTYILLTIKYLQRPALFYLGDRIFLELIKFIIEI